jgi:hypothetical protein
MFLFSLLRGSEYSSSSSPSAILLKINNARLKTKTAIWVVSYKTYFNTDATDKIAFLAKTNVW